MLNSTNSSITLPKTSIRKKNFNSRNFSSPKTSKTSSFRILTSDFEQKCQKATIHITKISRKSPGQIFLNNQDQEPKPIPKKIVQQNQNPKKILSKGKSRISKKNLPTFNFIEKQNIQSKLAINFTEKNSGKQNRLQKPFIIKRRQYAFNRILNDKDESDLVKKSAFFVKRDLSLTMKNFTQTIKQQLSSERTNNQKEQLYYVDELKRQMDRMQVIELSQNERVPFMIGHFLQSVSTFFRYRDLKQPKQPKISVYLPKQKKPRTTIIFDMDETLIHAEPFRKDVHENSWGENLDVVLDDGIKLRINLKVRPFAVQVLQRLKEKYEIGIFTAANQSYAKQILQKLDPTGKLFDFQLFRQHCEVIEGKFAIKDLRILSNRLCKNLILVDNSPHTYLFQKDNAIPMVSFYDDRKDDQMLKLERFVEREALDKSDDVRTVLKDRFKLRQYTEFGSLEEIIEQLY